MNFRFIFVIILLKKALHSFKQYILQISKNYDLMISIVNNNNFVGKEESQDHND